MNMMAMMMVMLPAIEPRPSEKTAGANGLVLRIDNDLTAGEMMVDALSRHQINTIDVHLTDIWE